MCELPNLTPTPRREGWLFNHCHVSCCPRLLFSAANRTVGRVAPWRPSVPASTRKRVPTDVRCVTPSNRCSGDRRGERNRVCFVRVPVSTINNLEASAKKEEGIRLSNVCVGVLGMYNQYPHMVERSSPPMCHYLCTYSTCAREGSTNPLVV